jgi:uncharacterized protein (TIGR02147 family)
MSAARPSVFRYLDYREYLRDFYRSEKQRRRTFSYRSFSRRIGVKSPGHLKRVVDGERNLTGTMALKYAKVIGLKSDEARYFSALVQFNNATSSSDRDDAYGTLVTFRRYREAHRLDVRHAEYCSHWYVPAIRELAARPDFRNDPEWIAAELRPAISAKEAAAALETLFELGFLRDEGGVIRQRSPVVSTGTQTDWVHVARYHRAMMQRASEAIDNFPAEERDLSSVTLCVPKSDLPGLKKRVAQFRRSLLSHYEDRPSEQVVQVNIQLFPLSNAPEDD